MVWLVRHGQTCRLRELVREPLALVALNQMDSERVHKVETGACSIRVAVVIFAVPWFALTLFFPSGPPPVVEPVCSAADEIDSLPIIMINLWLDRSVIDRPFFGLSGRALQWVFDKWLVFSDAAAHLTFVIGAALVSIRSSNSAFMELATDEIRTAWTAACNAAVTLVTVVREPRATFSPGPGATDGAGDRDITIRFSSPGRLDRNLSTGYHRERYRQRA